MRGKLWMGTGKDLKGNMMFFPYPDMYLISVGIKTVDLRSGENNKTMKSLNVARIIKHEEKDETVAHR
jgi:hypothetical protein